MWYLLLIVGLLAASPAAAQSDRWYKLNACGSNTQALIGLTYSQVVEKCGPPARRSTTSTVSGQAVTLVIGTRYDGRRLYVMFVNGVAVSATY